MTTGPYTRKSARSAAFHSVLLRVPAQAATLVSYVILVRFLSEAEFGVYSLFYAMLPVLGSLVSFGMENTLRRYQPEYLRKGENQLAHRLSRRVGLLRLATTTTFLVAVLVFWDQLAPLFKVVDYREHFMLFSLLIVGHFQCQILTMSLSAHLLQKYSVGLTAVFSILKVIGYGVAALAFEFDLWLAIVADLVAYCVFFVGLKYAYLVKADHQKGSHEPMPPQETKRIIRYAAYYSFNDAGTLALGRRKDHFFLAALMDTISVGAFAFAQRFNDMLGRLSPAHLLESVIQPMFVSLDYKENPQRIHLYFSLLMTVALLIRVPTLAFTVAYHREIVEVLFGGRFIEYSYLLGVVALFSLGAALGDPVTLVAQLEEKAQFVLASKIFGLYGIAMSLLLIPLLGVLGAVIATGTAILFKNLFIWWFVRRLARWQNASQFLLRAALIWTTFGVVAWLLRQWVGDRPIIELVAGLVVWSAFFLVQVRASMGAEQKRAVGNLFSGRERKLLRLLGVV